MTRLSGWCGQLGTPDHAGCRIPAACSCGCPEDAAKLAQLSGKRGAGGVEFETKRGPDRANESDPLATVSTTAKGA